MLGKTARESIGYKQEAASGSRMRQDDPDGLGRIRGGIVTWDSLAATCGSSADPLHSVLPLDVLSS